MVKIKNILAPTDFSVGFVHSLNYAIEIAKSMDSTIHIIHTIEPIVFHSDFVLTKYGLDELANELELYSTKNLDKIGNDLKEKGVSFVTKIVHGKAYEEILKYAKTNHIDMICIATLGHSNFENFLFGSTTEKVLRNAKCPVLAVRRKEQEES